MKSNIKLCGTETGRFYTKKSNFEGINQYTGKSETLEESIERRKKHKRVERFNSANFTGFPIAILG